MSENDWFYRAHDIIGGSKNPDGVWIPKYQSGIYIWTPPPAAAQVAVEQLREARKKRTNSTHIFIVLRVFTSLWRRQLYNAADLFLELPFDAELWNKDIQHEPLTLSFVFPFLSHTPWQLRRAPAFLELGRMLPQMWKESPSSAGSILRKFCLQARSLGTMPDGVVRQMLQSVRQFRFSHSVGNQRSRSSVAKRQRQE